MSASLLAILVMVIAVSARWRQRRNG